jgi:lipocalin
MAIVVVIAFLNSYAFSQYGVAPEPPSIQTVAHVDLNCYLGLWYEIGRYPNSFQKG